MTDVKLDKGDNVGIELLLHIKKKNKDIPVIIISGHANIEMAVKSLKSGALLYSLKRTKIGEYSLKNALEIS